jgi:hypothetical protein
MIDVSTLPEEDKLKHEDRASGQCICGEWVSSKYRGRWMCFNCWQRVLRELYKEKK